MGLWKQSDQHLWISGLLTSLSSPIKPRRLWLSGRASNLLLEDHWFDFPVLHDNVSLGKILNPKLLLMCWMATCMAASYI